ncbi:helix-turn-helix transcriptional regulator [Methylobacterium litchii]|uniref:helix-turn-helix transcriptional regulator n=1 Tax=Methylobacterium litchii TaxID=3138810 RepID=UPI00399CE60C
MNHSPPRTLLTARDAARALSVSRSTLERMVAAGKLPPPVRISDRRIGFRVADIEAFGAPATPRSHRGGRV